MQGWAIGILGVAGGAEQRPELKVGQAERERLGGETREVEFGVHASLAPVVRQEARNGQPIGLAAEVVAHSGES